ncbi:Pospholipid-transporting_ATPase [Hexamita inflata]|uniref:Pospholipid-transporting ATPase n=2 Tax=Hexamita inflata TaxID=28002 RepID=A0AA86QGH4_9EUKA|nr:Pospholipid-transporting ATPase [Hexamita inflata]
MTTENTIEVNYFNMKIAKNNQISTCKYTWWNFLFKFLFEQYQKSSNIFYLANVICAYIPGAAIVKPSTMLLPVLFVLIVAALKEIFEDYQRSVADKSANQKQYNIIRSGQQMKVSSWQIMQGDLIVLNKNEEIPVDSLLLVSSDESGIAQINTAQLDGESNIKPKYQIFPQKMKSVEQFHETFGELRSTILTGPPCTRMDVFNGKIKIDEKDQNFTLNNVILRGSKLINTSNALLASIYTAKDCRVLQNSQKKTKKVSRLERRLNILMLFMIILAFVIMIIFSLVSLDDYEKNKDLPSFILEPSTRSSMGIKRFVQFFVMTSQLLPIALFITLEFIRFFQALIINADENLRIPGVNEYIKDKPADGLKNSPFALYAKQQLSAEIKNSVCVENLAEANIVFSDKTGTITKNQMTCHSIVNKLGQKLELKQFGNKPVEPEFEEIAFCLALCHSVLKVDNDFFGESTDEVAIVAGMNKIDVKLMKNSANEIEYERNGHKIRYQCMAVVPFNSDRKRMSVVLQEIADEDGKYHTPRNICAEGKPFIVTKGADSFVGPLMKEPSKIIDNAINTLSEKGLRSLVYGSNQLENMDEWMEKWSKTKYLTQDNDEYIDMVSKIERNLVFQGISAVEDELQDNLMDTIQSIQKAGMRFWMLTGDHTVTAQSIARSSGLIGLNQALLSFTQNDINQNADIQSQLNVLMQQAIDEQIKLCTPIQKQQYSEKLVDTKEQKFNWVQCVINKPRETLITDTVILLDSTIFRHILACQMQRKFIQVAISSKSVICSRLSPQEKALLIQLTHQYYPQLVTVAIGDGANDVQMIRAAQIGVGIAGKEGMYASNNADISIPVFGHLKRIIFVHGRLGHLRNSFICDYSIYKNTVNVFGNLLYQIFTKNTGTVVTESFLVMIFNTFITFFTQFAFGVSEIDCNMDLLMTQPLRLKSMKTIRKPNVGSIARAILEATWSGAAIFFILMYVFQDGVNQSIIQSDIYFFQTQFMICSIYLANMRIMMQVTNFNTSTLIALGLALFATYVGQIVGFFTGAFGEGSVGMLSFFYSMPSQYPFTILTTIVAILPMFLIKTFSQYFSKNNKENNTTELV